MVERPDLCTTWFETPQTVFFELRGLTVFEISLSFVFFFLYNFFQNFLQYMYFFSAVFGLKSVVKFTFTSVQTIITIEPWHEKTCLLGF